ncbi:MAG: hypothetical protein QX195_02160 [Methylococcaceae bacterium]|jgi:hypothetical protein
MYTSTRFLSNPVLLLIFWLMFAANSFAQDTPTSDFTDNGDGTDFTGKVQLDYLVIDSKGGQL